nr:retrovirus-related Pol polyprotein from transposon TNT 1-94 [Tanacetum cinerariifolium]
MFLWAKVVATACYTQNCSLIHTRHHKTPYELVHNKKHDLTFFRVFGELCYPTNDSEDLGKLQPTADTGLFVGYAPSRKGYRIYNKRTRRIMETIHVQFDELTEPMAPLHLKLEILFQPMFDEYLEPPRAKRLYSPAQVAQVSVSSAGTPLSTTIDQDAPSPHISPPPSALQSYSLPPGVIAEPHFMDDHNVASIDNNPFGISALLNHHTFLKHFIISINRVRITHSITSLAILLDQYQLENNSPSMPYGAYTVLYYPKLNRRISNLRLLKTAGFKPYHPTHVYRLKKALYGLKQAPRAWYDTLSRFLLDNNFSKGAVDLTLFTRKRQTYSSCLNICR